MKHPEVPAPHLPSVPAMHAERSLVYESRLRLPYPVDIVFDFFSRIENLDRVTPDWFAFEVRAPLPLSLEVGLEIPYILRWRGIPLRWTSRILSYRPNESFSYEQARGPYRSFFHDHAYLPDGDETLAIDRVFYRPWGGRLADRLLVRRDLDRIFEFRKLRSKELLTQWTAAGNRQTVPASEPALA